jgi:hypothetical protein
MRQIRGTDDETFTVGVAKIRVAPKLSCALSVAYLTQSSSFRWL